VYYRGQLAASCLGPRQVQELQIGSSPVYEPHPSQYDKPRPHRSAAEPDTSRDSLRRVEGERFVQLSGIAE
jgi:hypothetical protein